MQILVTGGANGLGAAFIEAYSQQQDNKIVCLDIQPLQTSRDNVEHFIVDMASETSIQRFAKRLGDRPIDLVVHSAGIRGLVSVEEDKHPDAVEACETLAVMDANTLERTFRINTVGTFVFLQAILPNLHLSSQPKVVIMSSRMGSIGNNQVGKRAAGGGYAYRASKAALNAMVRSLAVDVPALKCSEERPICAQCLKANRECIPSSGITFRHQQNPSMNGDPVARESLKSFYGYKETFTDQTIWVSVPRELTFVHTSNPYEDEDGIMNVDMGESTLLRNDTTFDESKQAELSLSQALYPTYATHGLEALSAVASQDQYNYAPAAPMSHQEVASHTSQADAASNAASQNLDFVLNPSGALSSPNNNIDPRLHTPTSSQQALSQGQSPNHAIDHLPSMTEN
ncbi:hypothetical protein AMS68_003103 [Peltaster fructicola]|uniref:Uncharacterized protein n=1 Tax=Peltaster fructicola TaxID=286661 RepID=A0A6H0XSB9_9PEZI|nr:hypothetical protein AMS68_003103 [Peltaster fructicola]